MDKELREYLREDEQVRWQGRPEPFPLLEGSIKNRILRTWIVTGVVVCGLLVWYFNFYEDKSAGFLGLMLIIAALIVISPVMERRNLLGQSYWITNQRVILRTRDNSYYYMNLDGIDEIRVIRDKHLSLQRRRAELLAQLGSPEDYLSEKPRCPLCGDTG